MADPIELQVTGMSCGNCVAHVKKALASVPGVTEVDVNLEKKAATVTAGAGGADVDQLIEAVRDAGYEAALKNGSGKTA
jgi:copper ion binding protein